MDEWIQLAFLNFHTTAEDYFIDITPEQLAEITDYYNLRGHGWTESLYLCDLNIALSFPEEFEDLCSSLGIDLNGVDWNEVTGLVGEIKDIRK